MSKPEAKPATVTDILDAICALDLKDGDVVFFDQDFFDPSAVSAISEDEWPENMPDVTLIPVPRRAGETMKDAFLQMPKEAALEALGALLRRDFNQKRLDS